MKVRQIVQFIVFPKFFNALWFYAKGYYSISFTLSIEDQDKNITTAYPILYQARDANQMQNKKAFVSTQNNIGKYSTQNFFITYNEESTILHTGCLFKIQYQKGVNYKTYLDVNLNLIKFKNIRGSQISGKPVSGTSGKDMQMTKKVTIVDKRRLYINRHQGLNKFKRLIFTQCQYFSFIDLYIASVSLGHLIRSHDYQMIKFVNFSIEDRLTFNYQSIQKNYSNQQQKGNFIFQAFQSLQQLNQTQNLNFIQKFYKQRIAKLIQQYERLVSIYNGFRAKMFLLNNNSQIFQKIKLPALNMLKKQQINQENLMKYYDCLPEQQLPQSGTNARNLIKKHHMIIYLKIMQEASQYRRNVIFIWQNIIDMILKMNIPVFQSLVIQEITFSDDFVKKNAIIKDIQIDQDSVLRQRIDFIQRRKRVLQTQIIYQEQDAYHPMLMIEGYEQNITPQKHPLTEEIQSLTIFIHGYQGSDYDLQKARNYMSIYNSQSHGLLVKSIQQQEDMNIQQLGKTLASQIKLHLIATSNHYKRINFIGYSLGGVLARQTLKHFDAYKNRMNLFISFASPHLGIRNSANSLVNTGIWYLVNVSKVKTMRQLHGQTIDNQVPTLKKLSDCEGLSWFNKVIVVSSKQDNFVPYYSSRLEQNYQKQIGQMCTNIKSKIKKLQRVQVWFDVQHDIKTWDKMLGRRAHIQFLQSNGFLDSFFKIYGKQL